MKTLTSQSVIRDLGIMALTIVFSIFALFMIDKDTHSVFDLFKPENLVATLVYFVPTFVFCYVAYAGLSILKKSKNRLPLSLVIGIPIGFIVTIVTLMTWLR